MKDVMAIAKRPSSDTFTDEENDADTMPMPMPPKRKTKKPKLLFEESYLTNIPSAEMYEKSYMHRDIVTHVVVAPETQFIITASKDGHVKFWKKMLHGIEFVKHYKAHMNEIFALAVSSDGLRLCSTSSDQNIKFYDVIGFDMVNMIKVGYIPNECCWIHQKNAILPKIAISDKTGSWIRIYQADQATHEPIHTIDKLHTAPVLLLGYNAVYDCTISCDAKGHIEYWNAETFNFPEDSLAFKYKGETDLYELAKHKTIPMSIAIDSQGENFALTAKDAQIRVFRFLTGKLRRKYDESLVIFQDAFADKSLPLDALDFGRRSAVEKELAASEVVSNCTFDESGHFLLYPTLLGIKVLNIETNKFVRILGKVENTDRFLRVALFQEKLKVNTQMEKQIRNASSSKLKQDSMVMTDSDRSDPVDPTLFCTSYKKNRFYLFSTREPAEEDEDDTSIGRDVFNEKPTMEELQVASESSSKVMGDTIIIHTTIGDITVKLFPKECPRTVENFCTHARNGYYDNVIFHRVIKNFMVQTGDPLGDGTGGESIWGGEFEDELNRNLRHDRAFTVSMANSGPNTNGSQFFITTVPTPWLDNKHTVFGRVEHGKDTVSSIEQTRTDKYDRPCEEIKILNIDVF
ncbi:hypothetical protein ABG067_004744 [Albugo candida]